MFSSIGCTLFVARPIRMLYILMNIFVYVFLGVPCFVSRDSSHPARSIHPTPPLHHAYRRLPAVASGDGFLSTRCFFFGVAILCLLIGRFLVPAPLVHLTKVVREIVRSLLYERNSNVHLHVSCGFPFSQVDLDLTISVLTFLLSDNALFLREPLINELLDTMDEARPEVLHS